MKNLLGRSGHVTLEKPVRAMAPNAGQSSVRLVAFEGKLVAIDDGIASFEIDGMILHPDDAVETKADSGLDVFATPSDNTVLHVRIENISGFQELFGFTRAQQVQRAEEDPGVVESEGFSREKRLKFAALSVRHGVEVGETQLARMKRRHMKEMRPQEFANHINEEMGDLHQRIQYLSLAVQALSDPLYDPAAE